jgi:ABC-2 type transport system ATP-binding protein
MSTFGQNEFAIEVTDLIKRYAKATTNAVDNVSFSVKRGEIFGLLGPNGAGKTTTIGVLTTSVIPTSGSAHIMGTNVVSDPIGAKKRISMVPQRSNLDRSLRVREILTFHARYHGVPTAELNARADSLLNEFGLGDRGKDKVQRYSGGQAQRVMLARALMHTPDILFLDEPTNNLDPQSRHFLWERIRALNERGMTILLTTHDMEEADLLCDRIAIMDHGRILVLDTSAELKKLIPGGTSLELTLAVPERVAVGADGALAEQDPHPQHTHILSILGSLPGATHVEQVKNDADGAMSQEDQLVCRVYTEHAEDTMTAAVQAVVAAGAELQNIRFSSPSLEDVFIHLTGRNMRS